MPDGANVVNPQGFRGFESHPLRKNKTAFAVFIFAMWDSKGSQKISTA